MNEIVHHLRLDVHKDSIAVSIAPANSTEIRRNRPFEPERGCVVLDQPQRIAKFKRFGVNPGAAAGLRNSRAP
ncbi:MAG: hypothetical protein ACTHKU_07960 [Verrucomicrobiota bacterium]